MDNQVILTRNDLTREVWTFWIDFPRIILDRYEIQGRSTPRHKWRTRDYYSRTFGRDGKIQESEVPFPPSVTDLIRKRVSDQLTVIKWSERR